MRSLLIETSTECALVAIMDGTETVHQIDLPFGYNNSQFLLPAIGKALDTANTQVMGLSLIVVGVGPGSYTGIRVGAITAKTLAYASKIPLVGICALEGFIPQHNGPFAALIDAKIGGAYVLTGVRNDDVITYTSAPMACPLDQLMNHLNAVKTIVTPNSKVIRPKLEEQFPNRTWEWEEARPSAKQLMTLALGKYEKGLTVDPNGLELLYLRKTQAEIEREAKASSSG